MSDDQASAARKPIAFISHHNSQEKTARHLKTVFERNGVIGWMAPDDIEPGVQFDRAIIEQVRKSDIIVLLFCAQSDQSKHVKREIMLAEDQDKLIYPVRLEAIEPTGLAYWLQDYQWIDWVDRRDATIERMLATVKRQVAARDAAISPAPPPPAENEGETAEAGGESVAQTPLEPPVETSSPAPPAPAPPPAATASLAASAPLAPMPLTDVGDILDGDDRGPGSVMARIAGFSGKIGRNGWIAIGIVGLLVLILIGIAIANIGGSSDTHDPDDDRSDDGDRGGSSGDEFIIQPGMWEARTEDVAITFPQLDASVAGPMIDSIESGSVDRDCVSEDEARYPGVSLFDPDGAGNCELDDLVMEGGEITADLTCRPADMQGGEMTYALRGGYTDTSVEGNVQVAIMPGTPNELRYRGRLTSRRTGQCD